MVMRTRRGVRWLALAALVSTVAAGLLASGATTSAAPYYNPYQTCCWNCEIPQPVFCPAGDIPLTVSVADTDSVAVQGVRVDLCLWGVRDVVIRGHKHQGTGAFILWPDSLWIVGNGPSAFCREAVPYPDCYTVYSDSLGHATFWIASGGSVPAWGYSLLIGSNVAINMGPVLSVDIVDEFGRVAGDSLYAPATCVVGLSDLTFLTPQFKGAPRDGYWQDDSTYVPADSLYTPLADFIRDEPRSRIMLSDVTFWTPHLQGAHSSSAGPPTAPALAAAGAALFGVAAVAEPDTLGLPEPVVLPDSLRMPEPDVTIIQKRRFWWDKVIHKGTE
jgi:hypothetical protein